VNPLGVGGGGGSPYWSRCFAGSVEASAGLEFKRNGTAITVERKDRRCHEGDATDDSDVGTTASKLTVDGK